jgi:hypothetical protein
MDLGAEAAWFGTRRNKVGESFAIFEMESEFEDLLPPEKREIFLSESTANG